MNVSLKSNKTSSTSSVVKPKISPNVKLEIPDNGWRATMTGKNIGSDNIKTLINELNAKHITNTITLITFEGYVSKEGLKELLTFCKKETKIIAALNLKIMIKKIIL